MLRSNGVRLLRSLPPKFLRHADEPVLDNHSSLSRPLICHSLSNFEFWDVFSVYFDGILFCLADLFWINLRYVKECAKGVIGHWIRDLVIHTEELLGTYHQKVVLKDNNASFNFLFLIFNFVVQLYKGMRICGISQLFFD